MDWEFEDEDRVKREGVAVMVVEGMRNMPCVQ